MLIAMAGPPGAGKSTIADVVLRARGSIIEVICSDSATHRVRREQRQRDLAHIPEPTWRAVQQRLDEYAPWTGVAEQRPRAVLDTVHPVPQLVESAVAFLRS